MFTFLACSTLLVLVVCPVSAALVNRTIDDYYGDSASGVKPLYEGSWNYGPECPGCYVQPEKARTFKSSWHDSTTSQKNPRHNVQFSFNGTAIWVYCVVPNHVSKATTFVNISFELDGEHAGHYTHKPDESSDEYNYNVTVYNNTQLAKVQHTLNMLAVHQGSHNSLLLFDWAEYTPFEVEDGHSSTSEAVHSSSQLSGPHTSVAAVPSHHSDPSATATASGATHEAPRWRTPVISCIVGGLGVAVIVFLVVCFICRRRRGRRMAQRSGRRESQDELVMPSTQQRLTSGSSLTTPPMHAMENRRPISRTSSITMRGTALDDQTVGDSVDPPTSVDADDVDRPISASYPQGVDCTRSKRKARSRRVL